jgi:beta-phosphoglucomutase family hydrolase
VEASGRAEFEPQYADYARHIEAIDPTYCKVLVRYNPEGDAVLNARQAIRLRQLSEYLHRTRRQFLFELLVPAEPTHLAMVTEEAYDLALRPVLTRTAMRELQDAGIEPDIWKLEGLDRREDAIAAVEVARRGGRHRVACIVLGRHAEDSRLRHWLEVASTVPGFVGFAVGRSTFWDPLVQLIARRITRDAAIAAIANNYRAWIDVWETARQAMLGLPARIEACLFDLDGVLTQTASIHAEAWKRTFDDYLRSRGEAFTPFGPVDYARYVDGKPREDGVRSFLGSRGITLPDDEVKAIGDRKNALVVQLLRKKPIATYASSVRYVQAARDAGLKTAVVSSSKNTREVLRAAGIDGLFDVRIDGSVAEQRRLAGKPAPDTYLAAADALAVEPAHAVVFEDALAGVEAGHAGHFGYVVGVDRANHAAALRAHGADVVVADLANLMVAP